MTITEGKAGGATVRAGGKTERGELAQLIVGIGSEPAIIECRGTLINECEQLRGGDSSKIAGVCES